MWRLTSFTYWFNGSLIGLGIFYPGLSDAVSICLIATGTTNIMLREKTQFKLGKEK